MSLGLSDKEHCAKRDTEFTEGNRDGAAASGAESEDAAVVSPSCKGDCGSPSVSCQDHDSYLTGSTTTWFA